MRPTMGVGLVVALLLLLVGCPLREGRRGSALVPFERHVLVQVAGDIEVDTGNPDVVAPRYRFESFESFDVTGLVAASAIGAQAMGARRGSGEDHYPYDEQKRAALEGASREVSHVGSCLALVNARADIAGRSYRPHFSRITTQEGDELTAEQVQGLCNGGVLP